MIRDAVLVYTGGQQIRLDPCSNENSIMGAEIEWFGPEVGGTDGLMQPWPHEDEGVTFMNPPYSEKYIWARKAYDEYRLRGSCVITLLPADMSEAWFHDFGTKARAMCYPRGRVTFGGDRTNPAPWPVGVLYYGSEPKRFKIAFAELGWCP